LQGASVIDAFLKDPSWKIRTVNRDPTKPECLALVEKGVEVVKGSFEEVDSLIAAFQGANVVFGVTDFWAPFFNPATVPKLAPGQLVNEYCYEVELQQGKNIADAVATIADSTLDLYVWSTLSDVRKWSKGKYTWVYHFDSKAKVYDYIKEEHPNLAKKTSTVQLGWYADNWKTLRSSVPQRAEDGVYELRTYAKSDVVVPWVDARSDTGKFVRALVHTAPGKTLLGVSQLITYGDYAKAWGEVNGVPTRFNHVSGEEYVKLLPDTIKEELLESIAYIEDFGWDGGEPGVLRPWDVSLLYFCIVQVELIDMCANNSCNVADLGRATYHRPRLYQSRRLVTYHKLMSILGANQSHMAEASYNKYLFHCFIVI
jgi:hypothetical protein